ncbi:ankyrin repeat-containing domain protein [Melanogaster broomeanus]|nr:ankyrin repeat-containing domain protein [Melanogaster broomeanus]
MRTGLNHLANCAPEEDDLLVELLLLCLNPPSQLCHQVEQSCLDCNGIAAGIVYHHPFWACVHATTLPTPFKSPRETTHLSMLHSIAMFLAFKRYSISPGDMPRLPPLIAATRNHKYREELVTLLLSRGSTVPRNALHSVLQRNADGTCKPFTIQILLQHGADVVLLEAGGESCLHSLLRHGYVDPEYSDNVFEIARLLVGAGCDPTALDDMGISPTHLTLRQGAFHLVEWLVENGFRLPPDAVLHAVRCRHSATLLPMLRLLFESGVVADVQDDNGRNALHILLQEVMGGAIEEGAFKLLLEKGCDIDCQIIRDKHHCIQLLGRAH